MVMTDIGLDQEGRVFRRDLHPRGCHLPLDHGALLAQRNDGLRRLAVGLNRKRALTLPSRCRARCWRC